MPLPLSHITPISGKPPTDTIRTTSNKTKEMNQDGIYYYPNADHKFQVGSKAS